jgi:hypothetical protein
MIAIYIISLVLCFIYTLSLRSKKIMSDEYLYERMPVKVIMNKSVTEYRNYLIKTMCIMSVIPVVNTLIVLLLVGSLILALLKVK